MSSVNEAAVLVDTLKQELTSSLDRFCVDLVETDTDTDPLDQEPRDEFELALQKALQTTRFNGLDDLRNTFLATTQLTTANVVSTVVTALAARGTRRKRSKLSTHPLVAPGSNQETRETVYGAPKSLFARSSKSRRGSSPHQAQLPTFRRSLPALSVPTKRLHRELLLERDAFMAQLIREREEKAQLECWAATRIQACFRGFRGRPRVVAYARRMKKFALRTGSSIRLDVSASLSYSLLHVADRLLYDSSLTCKRIYECVVISQKRALGRRRRCSGDKASKTAQDVNEALKADKKNTKAQPYEFNLAFGGFSLRLRIGI
ncbi:hypothetical protein PInf_015041 [Phytophthora infestans]|nr:hypothetical protein PInf_015041 [Phytophthora infestans]